MLQNKAELSHALKAEAKKEGFNPVGIATVPGSNRINMRTAALQRWLEAGHHADMKWMESSSRNKIDHLLEDINSVLAVGLNYLTEQKSLNPNRLLIAKYAWGNDYHKVIEKRLKRIGSWLETQRPGCKWKVCVDSKPLLEKAWAEEAGLGWIGKHSNLINNKNGSWMVLGFLLTSEELISDKPAMPLCGKCEKCIEACPTNAITEPFVINSKKCLAYHTIENRNHQLPINIENSLGNWIAGCDICQDICPWNKKSTPNNNDPDVQPKEWILKLTKEDAIKWSDDIWKEKLKGSSLKRIKPWMWRRNAKAIKRHQEHAIINKKESSK